MKVLKWDIDWKDWEWIREWWWDKDRTRREWVGETVEATKWGIPIEDSASSTSLGNESSRLRKTKCTPWVLSSLLTETLRLNKAST